MFDESGRVRVGGADELGALLARMAELGTDADDAELVERIAVLEKLKASVAAAQARMTAAFVVSQRAAQQAAGVPRKRWYRGISAQVALAKRESPARAARYTGWANVLVDELPRTFAALECGETTEWRAMVVARETIWLSRADRALVDAALADRLPTLGDRQVECEVKKLAYRLDPEGFLARSRAAAKDRRVTLRPAPDTMTRLTALLPAAQGVAAYTALTRAADAARAGGDERGRGQVMADTLVERVTGQSVADGVPVSINLVMTDRTLFNDFACAGQNRDDGAAGESSARTTSEDQSGPGAHADNRASGGGEPAHLIEYGPIPAGTARDLARVKGARAWLRRLYVHPRTGDLAAMESRARVFPERIRHALIIRDQLCRTPWCGAPIRHADHARSVSEGGETSLSNGQGLCEACNYAKNSPGWHTGTGPRGTGESVTIETPTGHRYLSEPPGVPGAPLRGPAATMEPSLGPHRGSPQLASAPDSRAA